MLHAWNFTPKPSIRNISHTRNLCLKPSPKRLHSRKALRSFVELLSINGELTTPIPAALQSFIPAFGPQPPGCDLPRNAWVQLNRLRTGVGRYAANMKLMGLCGSDLCECGKVQAAHHILHDCTKFKPPCQISKVDNTALLEYLTQSKFWPGQHVLLFMYTKDVPCYFDKTDDFAKCCVSKCNCLNGFSERNIKTLTLFLFTHTSFTPHFVNHLTNFTMEATALMENGATAIHTSAAFVNQTGYTLADRVLANKRDLQLTDNCGRLLSTRKANRSVSGNAWSLSDKVPVEEAEGPFWWLRTCWRFHPFFLDDSCEKRKGKL